MSRCYQSDGSQGVRSKCRCVGSIVPAAIFPSDDDTQSTNVSSIHASSPPSDTLAVLSSVVGHSPGVVHPLHAISDVRCTPHQPIESTTNARADRPVTMCHKSFSQGDNRSPARSSPQSRPRRGAGISHFAVRDPPGTAAGAFHLRDCRYASRCRNSSGVSCVSRPLGITEVVPSRSSSIWSRRMRSSCRSCVRNVMASVVSALITP